jgi:hypothetical protein
MMPGQGMPCPYRKNGRVFPLKGWYVYRKQATHNPFTPCRGGTAIAKKTLHPFNCIPAGHLFIMLSYTLYDEKILFNKNKTYVIFVNTLNLNDA